MVDHEILLTVLFQLTAASLLGVYRYRSLPCWGRRLRHGLASESHRFFGSARARLVCALAQDLGEGGMTMC